MFKPEVGKPCSFYHSGGVCDNRWSRGWRYGIVREIPSKGRHFGFIRIEIPVDLWAYDPVKNTWTSRPRERAWISAVDVNAPGDTTYHGPSEDEILQQRKEKKAAEQAKADKVKAKARRFHR